MASQIEVLAFGEVMLRLAAPDHERLLQSARLVATFGGAEANVAVSLARLGHTSGFISTLPHGALGDAAQDQLRLHGVDLSRVRRTKGRLGLYFLTPGAVQTPSEVIYDRAGSCFALARPEDYDWPTLLSGAKWLHLSGVTPAICDATCQMAFDAARCANGLGIKVSFDGNFRGKLWSEWPSDPSAAYRALLSTATLAAINELDIGLALGERFDEADPFTRRRKAADRAFETFPRLEVIGNTVRQLDGVESQTLSALLFRRSGHVEATPRQLRGVVDRIGGGDAFAAGLLHGLIAGLEDAHTIEFALAASVLKHAIPGDFNPSTEDEVENMIKRAGLDVRR